MMCNKQHLTEYNLKPNIEYKHDLKKTFVIRFISWFLFTYTWCSNFVFALSLYLIKFLQTVQNVLENESTLKTWDSHEHRCAAHFTSVIHQYQNNDIIHFIKCTYTNTRSHINDITNAHIHYQWDDLSTGYRLYSTDTLKSHRDFYLLTHNRYIIFTIYCTPINVCVFMRTYGNQ